VDHFGAIDDFSSSLPMTDADKVETHLTYRDDLNRPIDPAPLPALRAERWWNGG
jgi:hypothetical protein